MEKVPKKLFVWKGDDINLNLFKVFNHPFSADSAEMYYFIGDIFV